MALHDVMGSAVQGREADLYVSYADPLFDAVTAALKPVTNKYWLAVIGGGAGDLRAGEIPQLHPLPCLMICQGATAYASAAPTLFKRRLYGRRSEPRF